MNRRTNQIKTIQLLTELLIDQTALGDLTPEERMKVIRDTAYQIETQLEIMLEKSTEKPQQNEL